MDYPIVETWQLFICPALEGCPKARESSGLPDRGTTKWWMGGKAEDKDSHPIPDCVGTFPQGEDKRKRLLGVAKPVEIVNVKEAASKYFNVKAVFCLNYNQNNA